MHSGVREAQHDPLVSGSKWVGMMWVKSSAEPPCAELGLWEVGSLVDGGFLLVEASRLWICGLISACCCA